MKEIQGQSPEGSQEQEPLKPGRVSASPAGVFLLAPWKLQAPWWRGFGVFVVVVLVLGGSIIWAQRIINSTSVPKGC